jgi:hypothetical protein
LHPKLFLSQPLVTQVREDLGLMKDCRLTLRTQAENTPQASNGLGRRFARGGILLLASLYPDPEVIPLYVLLQTATLMFFHPGCLFFFYLHSRVLGV